jgi:hypothetical protein
MKMNKYVLFFISPISFILNKLLNKLSKNMLILITILFLFVIIDLHKQLNITSMKISQSTGGDEVSRARKYVNDLKEKYNFHGVIALINIENQTQEVYMPLLRKYTELNSLKDYGFWLWSYPTMSEKDKLGSSRSLRVRYDVKNKDLYNIENLKTINFFKEIINQDNSILKWYSMAEVKEKSELFYDILFDRFEPMKNNKNDYNKIAFFNTQSVDISHGYYQWNGVIIIGNEKTVITKQIIEEIRNCLNDYDWSLLTTKKKIR